MTTQLKKIRWFGLFLLRVIRFSVRVLLAFLKNRGMLLAGGVGYNILLSTIPLFALLAVVLTAFVDEQELINALSIQVRHLAPGYAALLTEGLQTFMDSRHLIGFVGIAVLLFFSTFAFRMLDDAMAVIFHQPDVLANRSTWISVLLPYAFMILIGAGLLALTILFTLFSTLTDQLAATFIPNFVIHDAPILFLNIASYVGMALLFTLIYKVLPIVKVAWRRAFIGGFVASLLWEMVRQFLLYYFEHISFVNVVYGSITTVIVVLISLEIAAVILLLGAQTIAELERSARHGLPWYREPNDSKRPN